MTGGAEGIDYIGKRHGVLLEFCRRSGKRKLDDRGRCNDIYDPRGQAHVGCGLALKVVREGRSKAGMEFERRIGGRADEALLDQRCRF